MPPARATKAIKCPVAANSKTGVVVWAAVAALAILVAGLAYLRIAPGIVDTKQMQAKQQLIVIRATLEKYRADNGRYPSQEEGLRTLVDPSPKGKYLTSDYALKDPWGRLIVYRLATASEKERYVLYSLGPNGVDDGKPDGNLLIRN
jgi:general secretion pathway protein G